MAEDPSIVYFLSCPIEIVATQGMYPTACRPLTLLQSSLPLFSFVFSVDVLSCGVCVCVGGLGGCVVSAKRAANDSICDVPRTSRCCGCSFPPAAWGLSAVMAPAASTRFPRVSQLLPALLKCTLSSVQMLGFVLLSGLMTLLLTL